MRGDIRSALGNAVVGLIVGASSGVLATTPLGVDYLGHGILAGVLAVVLGTALPPLLGGSARQFNAPRLALATVLATGAAALLAHPVLRQAFPQPRQAAEAILLLMPLAGLLAGLVQLAFGLLNLASIIKYVPYPVLTGIMDGITLIVVFGQLPAMLGYPSGTTWTDMLLHLPPSPLIAAIGTATLLLMLAATRWLKAIPPQVVGVGFGVLAFHGLTGGQVVGQTLPVGVLALPGEERFAALAALVHDGRLLALMPALATLALTLAIVATMQTLLALALADSLSGQRSSTRRELLAQGMSNVLTGALGGYASAGSAGQVRLHAALGGRTRRAHLLSAACAAAFLAILVATRGGILQGIPLCVMGAVLVHIGLVMTDRWTLTTVRRLWHSRDREERASLGQDLFVALLVVVLTVALDVLTALILGMAAAFLMFLNRSEASLVRRRTTGCQRRSMSQWSRHCEDLLQAHGQEFVVLELQQPIFFGSADKLQEIVETEGRLARYLILDLKRVPDIDSTGAQALLRAAERLRQDGRQLLLAHAQGEVTRALHDFGVVGGLGEGNMLATVDDALARAEFEILSRLGVAEVGSEAIALAGSVLGTGLSATECEILQGYLEDRCFADGDCIVRDGDAGREMFLVLSGSAEVSKCLGDSAMRLSIIRPGAFFGEMAMFSEIPRSADVFARGPVHCACLSLEHFAQLEREHPELARRLFRNLYATLASRLRQTNNMVRELAS